MDFSPDVRVSSVDEVKYGGDSVEREVFQFDAHRRLLDTEDVTKLLTVDRRQDCAVAGQ